MACTERETRTAIKSDSTSTSTTTPARPEADSVLVYSGPLPTADTIPAAPVPQSQMESGVTYYNGRRMNFGAFDSVARRLALPRIVPDGCAEDGCGFPWQRFACHELALRATDSDDAPLVGKIAAGDTFTIESSHLQIVAPAKVLFRKDYAITEAYGIDGAHGPRPDTVRFAAGDTLYVFEHGEEFTRWWYRGMLGRGLPFWDEGDELSPQRTVTWYEVTRPNAASAWWKSQGSVFTSVASRCES
jgi:hypothetical protein